MASIRLTALEILNWAYVNPLAKYMSNVEMWLYSNGYCATSCSELVAICQNPASLLVAAFRKYPHDMMFQVLTYLQGRDVAKIISSHLVIENLELLEALCPNEVTLYEVFDDKIQRNRWRVLLRFPMKALPCVHDVDCLCIKNSMFIDDIVDQRFV